MSKVMDKMLEQVVRERDIEKISVLFAKNWSAEQIIDVIEYDRSLVYSVQKELLQADKMDIERRVQNV